MNDQTALEFEGLPVRVIALKLTGGGGGGGLPLRPETEVVIVCRATIAGVNHVPNADGVLVRTHTAKASEAWVIPSEMSPDTIIADPAKLTRDANAGGQTRLDEVDDE